MPYSSEPNPIKQDVVGVFDRAASLYAQVGIPQFAYFGRLLVEKLNIPAGAQVLDVATGRGALLFAAAEMVGPEGRVTGIDLAPAMVEMTAAEITARGLAQAAVLLMDADQADFPDRAFDFILCGSALHFLDYPRLLVRFRRMLKPGGWLGTTHHYVPTGSENFKQWEWLFTLTREVFPPDFEPPAAWVAPNRLNRPEAIYEAFSSAGFEHIDATRAETIMYFADEEDWWAWEWSQGSRFWVEGMSEEGRATFKRVSFERLAAMKEARGIPIQVGALLATARAPQF